MYKKHCQKWGLDLDLSFYVLNGNKKKPQNIKKVLKIFLPPYTPKQFFFSSVAEFCPDSVYSA